MKKIKIIDLLNMIANGEEVPKKIKHDNYIYELKSIYDGGRITYYDESDNDLFSDVYCDMQDLNEEIEMIEDKPTNEIEKIKWNEKSNFANCGNSSGDYYAMLMARTEQLKKGLNKIIDVLNELKNKEND